MTELADSFHARPDELAAAIGKRRWHTKSRQIAFGREIEIHIKPSRISLSVARERHSEAKCGQRLARLLPRGNARKIESVTGVGNKVRTPKEENGLEPKLGC